MTKKLPPGAAYAPADYDIADVKAIKQLMVGQADEEQQKRALNWIVNVACATYDQPFRPGKDGQTEFACGRQFAGQQIVKLTKIDLVALQESTAKQRS